MQYSTIKVYQGLEKNKGLSIWIYANIEDLPARFKNFKTMERNGCLEYHCPSAKAFWDWLGTQPSDCKWETIYQDKRKKMSPREIIKGIQMKVIEPSVTEQETYVKIRVKPNIRSRALRNIPSTAYAEELEKQKQRKLIEEEEFRKSQNATVGDPLANANKYVNPF